MDPPLFDEGSFSASNPSFVETWPLGAGGFGGGFRHGLMDGLVVDNGGRVNRDCSIDGGGSTVTEQSGSLGGVGGVGKRTRDSISEHESNLVSTTSGNELDPDAKRLKLSGPREEKGGSNAQGESSACWGKPAEKSNQQLEPPKDYIHVRARRGQATDSHSLAERARREKISERMKILQDLVPGCNKVIGKALVLDEIINYIQSLQQQVEFLSMKLETVNSGMPPSINGFIRKELSPPTSDAMGCYSARELAPAQAEWLHMQLGGGSKEMP